VVATGAAATAGVRGLRVTSVAGARASLQRPLPHASDDSELAFDLSPRTFSSARAWIDIAAITSAGDHQLASVQVRADGRGRAQVRLSSFATRGAATHSPPYPLRRRTVLVVLSLDATRAALTIDGRQLEPIARATLTAPAAGVALGTWRGAPAASSGYLDFDRVTVQIAPPAP
jgi:hypothetical protein